LIINNKKEVQEMAKSKFKVDVNMKIIEPKDKKFTHASQVRRDIERILRENGYKISQIDCTYEYKGV
jgi:hypothetical protein